MRHSLHSHIIYLENTIQGVKNRLARRGLPVEEVEDLQLQLALAESALEHYRKAYALELTVSGSEPPSATADNDLKPGALSDHSKPKRKTDNKIAISAHVRHSAARPANAPRHARTPRVNRFSSNRGRQRSAGTGV